jgi:hypothetical protein
MGNKLGFLQFGRRSLFSHFKTEPEIMVRSIGPINLIVKTDGCQELQVTPNANIKIILIGNGSRPNVPDSEYIQIHDPTIYSTHCMLAYHRIAGWKIERLNCDSVRSTEVNGMLLEKPKKISNGDLIRVGNTTLKIKIG